MVMGGLQLGNLCLSKSQPLKVSTKLSSPGSNPLCIPNSVVYLCTDAFHGETVYFNLKTECFPLLCFSSIVEVALVTPRSGSVTVQLTSRLTGAMDLLWSSLRRGWVNEIPTTKTYKGRGQQ